MIQKILALCGMLSLSLFVLTVIVGGALRPGYSHISDTVSELFSPGAPNKMLLDVFHTTSAVLTVLFGIGVLLFVRESDYSEGIGITGAILIIFGAAGIAYSLVFSRILGRATFSPTWTVLLAMVAGLGVSLLLRNRHRKRVGLAMGVFDFCHVGHLNFLRRSAARCDALMAARSPLGTSLGNSSGTGRPSIRAM